MNFASQLKISCAAKGLSRPPTVYLDQPLSGLTRPAFKGVRATFLVLVGRRSGRLEAAYLHGVEEPRVANIRHRKSSCFRTLSVLARAGLDSMNTVDY